MAYDVGEFERWVSETLCVRVVAAFADELVPMDALTTDERRAFEALSSPRRASWRLGRQGRLAVPEQLRAQDARAKVGWPAARRAP